MSNNNANITTIGMGVRLPVIPFKRVFKDMNRYNRKSKHKRSWE